MALIETVEEFWKIMQLKSRLHKQQISYYTVQQNNINQSKPNTALKCISAAQSSKTELHYTSGSQLREATNTRCKGRQNTAAQNTPKMLTNNRSQLVNHRKLLNNAAVEQPSTVRSIESSNLIVQPGCSAQLLCDLFFWRGLVRVVGGF